MRGFVKISATRGRVACNNFEKAVERGKIARHKGLSLYHEKYYHERGWFHRWRYRNHSEYRYAQEMVSNSFIWGELSEVLHLVLSEDELQDLKTLENWNSWGTQCSQVRNLVSSGTMSIYVDSDLASFINVWLNKDSG